MTSSDEQLERTSQALERGRGLYAAGRFFEAHEVWEEAWRVETGPTRQLLQGLILAAAAYHKMTVQRHAGGMVRLLDKALERLQPLPDVFAGLELVPFRAALARSREEALAWLAGGPAPSSPARLDSSLTDARRLQAPEEGL